MNGRARLAWCAVAAYMGLIFYLSTQSNPLPELTSRVWDKLLHGVEYGTLGGLVLLALRASGAGLRRALPLAVLVASLYGVTDELHQAFVPNRSCDVRDWIADTLGACAGAAATAGALRALR